MAFQHDYYAHPTCFDRYNAACSDWALKRYTGSRSYLWFWAFTFLAVSCYLGCLYITYGFALIVGTGESVSGWRAIANTIAMAMALGGGVQFHRIAREISPVKVALEKHPEKPSQQQVYRRDVQLFFQRVRDAGIDVATAKALFSANVRTLEQLCLAGDAQLLALPGIDETVLNRLRRDQ